MKKQLTKIEKQIQKIKDEIITIGELRPGSLSKQYNVCGNPSCKCKDPNNPKKHGPYYQISYCRKGKSSSAFVRSESLADVEMQLANYKRLMELVNLWIDLALEHSKLKLNLTRNKNKKEQ
ncbi:MAG: hypothetical protein L6428_04340 [Candidatus Aminicenantes bacterium]|nr:hypothetical protein [Candidatus Aminicenantes bacterium]